MKDVLCIVDFSAGSKKVLETASDIALKAKAHLKIVFPYRLLNFNQSSDVLKLKSLLEEKARENFRLLEKKTLMKKVSYDFYPEVGFIADRVKAHAKTRAVEMVIMGNHQAGSLYSDKDLTLENFVKELNIPLLLVPEEATALAA